MYQITTGIRLYLGCTNTLTTSATETLTEDPATLYPSEAGIDNVKIKCIIVNYGTTARTGLM